MVIKLNLASAVLFCVGLVVVVVCDMWLYGGSWWEKSGGVPGLVDGW